MAERRSAADRIAGELAAAAVRAIEPDAVLSRVDVDMLVARIDVDALAARIDVDGLLARVDLDALVQRVDVEALAKRIDLDELLAHVDVAALVAQIDLDELLARVDVDALVERIDVGTLAERVPVERMFGTPELQRAVDSIDLGPALRRAGLADIVAQSVGRSTLDTVRRRVVAVDAVFERVSGSLLRQDIDAWPAGPVRLVGEELGPLGDLDASIDGADGWNVAGHHVGPVGRVLATALDLTGAIASYGLTTSTLASLAGTLLGTGNEPAIDSIAGVGLPIVWGLGLALWLTAWFLLPLEVVGRTPAMSLLGMRVVTVDGDVPRFRAFVVRCLAQVPSVLLLGAGYVITLVNPRRRTLHDLAAGTAVVWDWGDRDATIASPLGRWVARHPDSPIGTPPEA